MSSITLSLYDDGSFSPEETFDTPEKQKFAAEVMTNLYDVIRNSVTGTVTEFYYRDGIMHVQSQWDDYCRGCHMGTETEHYEFPVSALFSSDEMHNYLIERKAKIKAEAEAALKRSEVARKRANENHERAEFKRLAAKFATKTEE